MVVTASSDKTARLWDATTGKPLGEPMRHEGWVHSDAFSPDGTRVVTASDDKTARLWDIGMKGSQASLMLADPDELCAHRRLDEHGSFEPLGQDWARRRDALWQAARSLRSRRLTRVGSPGF